MATATTMTGEARTGRGPGAQQGGARLRAWYARFGALAGYALAALAVWIGWDGRVERNITAKSGLGYALGIVGGTLMLVLLFYSVRKRLPWMRHLGATRHWFRGHMILGILGPLLILFHCNFKLGDLNSRVALYCTLLVAGSGIVGRYLYSGFHEGLYGRQLSLQEVMGQLESAAPGGRASTVTAEVRTALEGVDQQVLAPPEGVMQAVLRPFAIEWQTRAMGRRLRRLVHKRLVAQSAVSLAIDQHAERLEASVHRYLDDHLRLVRRVAQFRAFERLFALWHVVHVPFFFMLVISAIVHVVAVHLY